MRTGQPPYKVLLDLADAKNIEAASKEIISNFPIIDVLVNHGVMWLEQPQAPYNLSEVMSFR